MPRTRDVKAGSADIILRYVGDGRSARNVPADDLTGNDIARLAFKRDLAAVAQDVGQPIDKDDPESELYVRPDPRNPSEESIRIVLDELIASKLYEAVAGSKADKDDEPAEKPDDDKPPATPADKPEVPTNA